MSSSRLSILTVTLLLWALSNWTTGLMPVSGADRNGDEAGRERARPLPYAYVFAASWTNIAARLQQEGITVEELREQRELEIEYYRLPSAATTDPDSEPASNVPRPRLRTAVRWVELGAWVVKTGQKFGQVAADLLEPGSEKGLLAQKVLSIEPDLEYPVLRLRRPISLLTTEAKRCTEERKKTRRVTFDTLFGREKVNFSGSPIRIEAWLTNGQHYLEVRDGRLHRVHAATGRSRPFFSSNRVARALMRLPSVGENGKEIAQRGSFQMNPDRTGALIDHGNDLYFVRLDGSKAVRLTSTPAQEELASFSPDGQFVAFVREDDLYVVDITTQVERALTTDGGGDVRNGKADWVYFEELYNRSWKAYWWSPDSRRIAFYRFDDSALPMFHALNTLPLHGQLESMRHPKAGDPNPHIQLGVANVSGSPVTWAPMENYLPGTFLIAHVGWFPKGDRVFFYVQDRIQTWLDFDVWDVGSGKVECWFRDKTPAWIESPGDPQFIDDHDFLITSDRSGWKHLYHFSSATKEWRPVTSGDWEVRAVHQLDRANGWIYFSATRDSHIAENLYRCRWEGEGIERLTQREGHHRVQIDPKGNYFIDHWSDFKNPEQVRLYRTDGTLVRVLDSNPVHALEEFEWGQADLLQIPSQDGFLFEAAIVKPVDFLEGKKYPVWFSTYGGPHAPSIRNAWGPRQAYDQMLAEMGLIVFRMDPRSASGKGSVSAWTAFRQLGVKELEDITEAIEWLKQQPFVDGSRIGMSGHSYGGFMTAYAMTHSELFAAGISGAPVTDWQYYDSIYTERYMDVPQNNRSGYEKTSVVKAAGALHGKLLLLHGMMDDNVHMQNATQFIDALQKADKSFEVMFYPEMKHALSGDHYNRLIVDFIRRTLLE